MLKELRVIILVLATLFVVWCTLLLLNDHDPLGIIKRDVPGRIEKIEEKTEEEREREQWERAKRRGERRQKWENEQERR